MAKMTQTQIIAEMATKSGIPKKQVKDFLTDFTELAYREAKKGEFAIPGLGKLVKQKRKARLGRNPRKRSDCRKVRSRELPDGRTPGQSEAPARVHDACLQHTRGGAALCPGV